jgi:hypothetical protein
MSFFLDGTAPQGVRTSNSGLDRLSVLGVGDEHLLAAQAGLLVKGTVATVVGSNDQVVIAVVISAGTSGATLVEERGAVEDR